MIHYTVESQTLMKPFIDGATTNFSYMKTIVPSAKSFVLSLTALDSFVKNQDLKMIKVR